MDQPTTGNFIAYMNRNKEPGDSKPTFDGKLSVPGSDGEQTFALWAHEYKDPKTDEVKIMFNGRADVVSPTDAPMAQVAALMSGDPEKATLGNLSLSARQLVLFPNRFKAEAPEKSARIIGARITRVMAKRWCGSAPGCVRTATRTRWCPARPAIPSPARARWNSRTWVRASVT